MNKQKILYFNFYFVFVTVSFFNAPFIGSFLNNPTLIGYATSIGLFSAIIIMLIISFLEDNQILTAKQMLIGTLLINVISYCGLIFTTTPQYLLTLYILNLASLLALPAFFDSFVLDNIEVNKYANIRSYGSIGAAISYFISSYILGTISFSYIVIINSLLLLIIIFLLLSMENPIRDTKMNYKQAFKSALKNKNIILIMIIAFLTYGVIKADDPYTISFNIEYVNLTAFVIGIVGLFSIMFEAAIMRFFNSICKVISQKKLLIIISLVLAFIFYTKYQFYEIKWLINLGNIMLGLFVGLFIPIVINIITKEGDKKVQTTILSLYQSMTLLGGAVLGAITAFLFGQTQFLPDIYLLHLFLVLLSIIFIAFLKDIE